MYPISPLFAELLRQPDREFKVRALVNGEEYNNDEIVDFTIDNSITSTEGFEVGTAIPSTLTINIRTSKEIAPNSRIIPYVALSTASLTWEQTNIPWNQMDIPWDGSGTSWLPLGEFFVDKRERINNVWSFTCLDKLIFADVAYISSLTYPTTQKAVLDEICGRLGWVYDSTVQINPSYMIQVGPAGYTMRQVLGYIAGANSSSVVIGKDGKVRFRTFSTMVNPVFEMKPSDYIRAKQVNPIKTYSRLVVTYNTEDDLYYEAGIGSENQTLNFENPFMTQTMVNNLLSNLDGFAYLPVSMDARGFPHLEHGDVIGFEQDESSAWMDTHIAWQDLHIPWNGMVKYRTAILKQQFSFKGGLKMSIDSPSVSEQQSEFVVEGSLTQQVNKLDKNAVKEGKKYYGATITRTEGLIIEREDHLSKAVFNSDELSFYADGDRALWFDLPNRKFKFSGTLEGVDGKFSGTIEGGKFLGGEIEIGSGNNVLKANEDGFWLGNANMASAPFKVNMQGFMEAEGAKFKGEINSSVITGSQVQTNQPGNYPRAEMSSTDKMFSVWSSSGKGIRMEAYRSGGSFLSFLDGSGESSISFSATSGLQILGHVGGDVEISARDIDLRASRYINVYDWSDIKNTYSQSLQEAINEMGFNLTFDNTTRNLKLWSRSGSLLAQVTIS
ncbi:hypothetical protein D3C76_459220 [compost metagenome]